MSLHVGLKSVKWPQDTLYLLFFVGWSLLLATSFPTWFPTFVSDLSTALCVQWHILKAA